MENEEKLVLKIHSFNGDILNDCVEVSKSQTRQDLVSIMTAIDPNFEADTNQQFYVCSPRQFDSKPEDEPSPGPADKQQWRVELLDTRDISECVAKLKLPSTEETVNLLCVPESTFRVHPATRCTSSIEGHKEAVLSVKFAPNCKQLLTGSGDNTCKLISMQTELVMQTLKASSWVMTVSFSLDSSRVIYGDKKGFVYVIPIKDIYTSQPSKLKGHSDYISHICHRPYYLDPESRFIATCSKDKSIIIWDTIGLNIHLQMSGHLKVVSCIVWTGCDFIISSSNDCIINIWDAKTGGNLAQLKGHAHWVNYLSVSSEWVLSTSQYDSTMVSSKQKDKEMYMDDQDDLPIGEKVALSKLRQDKLTNKDHERFISCSDDFKIMLWRLDEIKIRGKEDINGKNMLISKIFGHQQSILMARFSPNGVQIASVSFDKSLRLQDGQNGSALKHLHSHVGPVQCVAWSADSRYVATCSKDSTLKIWEVKSMSRREELHSHQDEVYSLDWSTDGTQVASGGKDRMVKIWRN